MDSPFKTPSKLPMSQFVPSSGSCSPFTPKRSRIKKKNNEEFNSVSRVLAFDCDSNDVPSSNINQEFSPFSQPNLKLCENPSINSRCTTLIYLQQTTPVKHQQTPVKHQQTTPIKHQQTTPVKSELTPVKMQEVSGFENNKILLSPSIKNRPNRFNIPDQDKDVIQSYKKRKRSNSSTPSKKKLISVQNCKPITDYFKPIQKRSDSLQLSSHEINDNFQLTVHKSNENLNPIHENVKSSSEHTVFNQTQSPIKSNILSKNDKNPRNKMSESPLSEKTLSKQTNIKLFTPKKSEKVNNSFNPKSSKSPTIIEHLTNKVIISGGDTYSRFIKTIVKAEICVLGKSDIWTTITNSTHDELKIYGRLFSRKHGWIRSSGSDGYLKYKELNLCNNFDGVLKLLTKKQLIDTNVISSELECLLNILKMQELKDLQKIFNINLNNTKSKTKPEIIKSFINLVKQQKTFCGNSVNNLKKRISKILGPCLKLSDKPRDDIISCLIFDSYPYFRGEEKDRFRECFTKFTLVEKNELKFPNFETSRVSVNFNSPKCLEMYKIALILRQEIQVSCEQKDYENAIIMLKNIFEKLKSTIHDKELLSHIPTYMRKYSAVSVYAYTLFKNVSILKKSTTDIDLTRDVLEFLLKHKEFFTSKRAELHIELAKVFETQYKQIDSAAKVILDGLKDETMSELSRQMLSSRAVMYANRKVRKLNTELKNELLSLMVVNKKELPTTTISGKIIAVKENASTGLKQVYSKKTENGDILYMSVEELAITHYKSQGFLYGIHDEGQLIKSMFLLCFWDIIYGNYPPHILFISQYQDCPLDWRTRHFYNIREQKIQDRLKELKQMHVDNICDMLKTCCDEYCDTQSVINWKLMNVDNLPKCKTLLECMGIDLFLAIGNQILKDSRVYLHGMPDLVVWDDVAHKCIFVEVKGPKDKLSEKQTLWLYKLIEFGANVEVCHVVGTGGKT